MMARVGAVLLGVGLCLSGCGADETPTECITAADGASECPWPAEALSSAVNLTAVEGAEPNDFYVNLSAADWSSAEQILWVARNGPDELSKLWALTPDGAGGMEILVDSLGQRAEWTHFGDLEGLTHIEGDAPFTVYLVIEGEQAIESWDLQDFEDDHPLHRWDVGAWVPYDEEAGRGAEALAFVPDAVLEAGGFTDADGAPVTSAGGLGGLMLVGNQADGRVYAFDLDATGTGVTFVGSYATSGDEIAGMELDEDAGQLYLWHSEDSGLLEVTRLSSSLVDGVRILDPITRYLPPDDMGIPRHWEGIAVRPAGECTDAARDLFLTDDTGEEASLMWFQTFPCP